MALEDCECQETREGNVPTYQYACTACGHKLEAVQSFTDEPLTECPECAGRLRKLFSSVGIVFKGSGFYRNDSRSDAKSTDSAAKEGAKDGAKDGAKETVSTGSAKSETSTPAKSDSSSSTATPAKTTTATPAAA
ncbi:MAG TPA: FmdB family zinc ribbon protein [Rugosimonospora sp.]|nr:FmdB family zinc ribbon protein [Rugosimonospora sp.]